MRGLDNKKNCTGVREVPNTPVYAPCGGNYHQTDCIFFSDGVLDGSMDLGANPTLTEFVKCLLRRIGKLEKDLKEKGEIIDELESIIKKIQ